MIDRISERINITLEVKLFCCRKFRPGVIRNLSESDMYVDSESCSQIHSEFEVLIPSKKGILTVPVEICRMQKDKDNHVGMGLKIKKLSSKYSDFVNKLRLEIHQSKKYN